jgi:hypothetical protein
MRTHHFFKRKVFDALKRIATAAEQIPFPAVDERFLDSDFDYEALKKSFFDSIAPPSPKGLAEEGFQRSMKAAFYTAISYINWLGIPTDLEYSIEDALKWLAIAARGGNGQAVQAVLMLLMASEYYDANLSSNQPLPRRLWLAYGAAIGCLKIRTILAAEDEALYAKVNQLASVRGGPLLHTPDPVGFVERIFHNVVRSGRDVNDSFVETGHSSLHLAVLGGREDIVRELVERLGADVNQTTSRRPLHSWGQSALCLAAQNENEDICRFLLEHGADPNLATSTGSTVLHEITRFEDAVAADLARLLLSRGASLTALAKEDLLRESTNPFTHRNLSGSPLRWAAILNRPLLLSTLLAAHRERGESLPDVKETLERLSRYFNYEMLSEVLDAFQVLVSTGERPSEELLDELLEMSIHNHKQFNLVIMHGRATSEAQLKTVQVLLDRGARPLRLR